jgi:outer membrane biosynthesis protein TonB
MRFAAVVEPSGVHQDWSDEDATLVYDVPDRELDDLLVRIDATDTDAVPLGPARGLGHAQIVMTVVAALIGAMAAAWSIETQAPGMAPTAEALVMEVGKLWRSDDRARSAAATPRRAAPARPARAASPSSGAPEPPSAAAAIAAPAAIAEPAAVPEPAAVAEPPAIATPAQPEPARARTTAKRDRRMPGAAARSRSSRSAQPQPAATVAAVAPRASTSRTGLLRINSRPWSEVYVDGRPIGATPQTAIELRPGRHRIELISDEFDLKRTLTVKVRAGETITRSVELLQ